MADQLTNQPDGAYSIDDEQKGYSGQSFESPLSHKLNPIVKASSSAFFSPRNTIYIGYEGQSTLRTFLNIQYNEPRSFHLCVIPCSVLLNTPSNGYEEELRDGAKSVWNEWKRHNKVMHVCHLRTLQYAGMEQGAGSGILGNIIVSK